MCTCRYTHADFYLKGVVLFFEKTLTSVSGKQELMFAFMSAARMLANPRSGRGHLHRESAAYERKKGVSSSTYGPGRRGGKGTMVMVPRDVWFGRV